MSNFNVHRLRIGDWVPCAIKSIAVDQFSSKIAIGRENGDIEICDTSNKWFCQARIPGMKDFKLQALVWSPIKEQSGRLFGISLRGFVFEVDLAKLQITNIRDTYGGTAWAMSACPREPLLAIGCEDGVVRLFRYDSNTLGSNTNSLGSLEYSRSLPTSGSRILCVSYHPVDKRLFAGCSDGTVRCMEEETGRVLFRMLGDVLRGSVSTLIWSLIVLPDSTVVTGDSRGQVQVWDGNAGVLMDSFRQHTADVLTLAASADGSAVFAAGVDGKVICLQKSSSTAEAALIGAGGGRSRSNSMIAPVAADNTWVYVHAHRAHSHDVLALAVCTGRMNTTTTSDHNNTSSSDKKRVSFVGLNDNTTTDSTTGLHNLVLLSGGVDTRLCTYSVDNFVRTRPTWIPPIPTNTLIKSTQNNHILALRNRDYVDIWGVALQPPVVASTTSTTDSAEHQVVGDNNNNNCRLRLRLQLKGSDHIHCSALSNKGDFIAASSAAGVRIYEMCTVNSKASLNSVDAPITLKRAKLPDALLVEGEFAHSIAFYETTTTTATSEESGSSRKRSSSKGNMSTSTKNTTTTSTRVAIHCAKQGIILLCECIPSTDNTQNENNTPELRVLQTINHSNIIQSRTGSMERVSDIALTQAVNKMVFSADGRYLAVSSCSSKSIVYIYDTTRQKLHWILPPCTNTVTDFTFRTGKSTDTTSTLSIILLTAGNIIRIFDVLNLKVDTWSEVNDACFPEYVRELNAPLCGVTIDPINQDRLMLYGQSCCVHVDLSKPLSLTMKAHISQDASSKLLRSSLLKKRRKWPTDVNNGTPSKKRSALRTVEEEDDHEDLDTAGHDDDLSGAETDPETNFVVFNKYRNLLHVGYMQDNQLVVVENPWARVMPNLPDTLARKRYGT